MSHSCSLLARRHGFDPEQCEHPNRQPVHDIGKIGTPDHILLKHGKFNRMKSRAIALHPEIGCRILSGYGAELLKLAVTIARHEKFDGSGYPRGLEERTFRSKDGLPPLPTCSPPSPVSVSINRLFLLIRLSRKRANQGFRS